MQEEKSDVTTVTKLYIVLKHSRRMDSDREYTAFCQRLSKEGISVRLYQQENLPEADHRYGSDILCEQTALPQEDSRRGLLWITDDGQTAGFLRRKKQPVMGYLHEENKEQDFTGVEYVCEDLWEISGDFFTRVYQRALGIPWTILETKRCILRESTLSDVDVFYEIYREPSITEYMENLYPNPEEERRYMEDYRKNVYALYGFGVWTVICKKTGEIMGRAGLSMREGFQEPELGFVIGVPWQRKGYAYEVCRAILDYGAEEFGFRTVQAFAEPKNQASVNLLKKLGFILADEVNNAGKKYYQMVWEANPKALPTPDRKG